MEPIELSVDWLVPQTSLVLMEPMEILNKCGHFGCFLSGRVFCHLLPLTPPSGHFRLN